MNDMDDLNIIRHKAGHDTVRLMIRWFGIRRWINGHQMDAGRFDAIARDVEINELAPDDCAGLSLEEIRDSRVEASTKGYE